MILRRSFKLTKIGPKLTKVVASATFTLGGRIPQGINDTVTIPFVCSGPVGLATYFACVRPADAFDEGDGTVLGQLLYLKLHPHRKNMDTLSEEVLDSIRTMSVLRSAQAKYR
jgi:hypothetical protein